MGYNNDNRTPLERIDELFIEEMFDGGVRDIDKVSVFASCDNCNNKGSKFKLPSLSDMPLAMVYSPKQDWESLYNLEEGFSRGTIFKRLDFPFMASECAGVTRNRCGR